MDATLTVSEFKAKCLDIFNKLASKQLTEVTVTRRGKPVAVVRAPKPDLAAAQPLHGCMKGSFSVNEEVDLTKPIYDGQIDAELGILHR